MMIVTVMTRMILMGVKTTLKGNIKKIDKHVFPIHFQLFLLISYEDQIHIVDPSPFILLFSLEYFTQKSIAYQH